MLFAFCFSQESNNKNYEIIVPYMGMPWGFSLQV